MEIQYQKTRRHKSRPAKESLLSDEDTLSDVKVAEHKMKFAPDKSQTFPLSYKSPEGVSEPRENQGKVRETPEQHKVKYHCNKYEDILREKPSLLHIRGQNQV